jgi:isoamylase
MVIYELHVKGFTMQHPDIPPEFRGTYAGLTMEPAIEHLKQLGITTVELMPVHAFLDDRHLIERGCAITGDTTPSASWRRIRAIPRAAMSANSRPW